MTAIVTSTDSRRSAVAPIVSLKASWLGDWTVYPDLQCDWFVRSAAPVVSSGAFCWQFGWALFGDEPSWLVMDPLDPLANNRWVRVEVPQHGDEAAVVWIGRISNDVRTPDGALIKDDERIGNGDQTLVAYGPLVLLTQDKIRTSWFSVGEGSQYELRRGLVFNAPNQQANNGNRTPERGPHGVYLFASDLSTAVPWSTRDIVEHLLFYHSPYDAAGERTIPFEIAAAAETYLPDWDAPCVPTDGRTVKQLLDALISRQRLLGYTAEVDEASATVRIRPFSFADEVINIPGSEQDIPANDSPKSLDFDRAINIERATITKSAVQTYDQVVARGGRVLCCGTLSAVEERIVAGWSDAMETEYEAASSGDSDYGDLSLDEKEDRNKRYRETDRFARVFSHFSLPADWDEKTGDGEDEETAEYLFPFTALELDPELVKPWYRPGLRFEQYLPLLSDHDYSETRIDPGDGEDPIENNTPAGESWEYLRPIVLLKLGVTLDSGDDAYAHVEMLSTGVEETGDGSGREWSAGVRTQEDAAGLVLRVQGAPQHVLAVGGFDAVDDSDDIDFGALDWEDNLIATIAMRADRSVEGKWPATVSPPIDAVRTLLIDAGERYQLHYVAPNTVVGVDSMGVPVRSTTGGFVRNDRAYLEDLARVAYEWYGVERQTLSLQWVGADIAGRVAIGDLITTIGADETEETIRTVVTQLRVDFAKSDNETHHTSIETQWAELDVLQF